MNERAKIDQAAEHFEAQRASLFRPDGSKAFSDPEHDEREGELRREFHAALDHIGPAIEKRIADHERDVLTRDHADPSGALSSEELESANARRAFVADEVNGLGVDALGKRMRAVAASGDRPAMFLYAHHARAKMKTFDSEAEGLGLRELVSELESALDPEGTRGREKASASLEEARELKSYAHYRKHGAKDAVELYMNRAYGQAV